MLQAQTSQGLLQLQSRLRSAAECHGGSVLAIRPMSQMLRDDQKFQGGDAVTVSLCFPDLYAPLLRSDIRFAAFLPVRVALCKRRDDVFLEAVSPREYCRLIQRPEVSVLAESLEETLRSVIAEAAGEHRATEDMVNLRAALPQRIDRAGTKVEELAGTGKPDALGG